MSPITVKFRKITFFFLPWLNHHMLLFAELDDGKQLDRKPLSIWWSKPWPLKMFRKISRLFTNQNDLIFHDCSMIFHDLPYFFHDFSMTWKVVAGRPYHLAPYRNPTGHSVGIASPWVPLGGWNIRGQAIAENRDVAKEKCFFFFNGIYWDLMDFNEILKGFEWDISGISMGFCWE